MNPNTIPPYTEALFHEIFGKRSAKIADFKITSIKGSQNLEETSIRLQSILADLASLENQLEILVGMYPSLRASFPKVDSPEPAAPPEEPNPKPSDNVTRPPFAKEPPQALDPKEIEGKETPLYEDGKVISSFKKDS